MKQYRMGRMSKNGFGLPACYGIDRYEEAGGMVSTSIDIIRVEDRVLAEQIIELLNRVEAPSTDPMFQAAFTIRGKTHLIRGSREAVEVVADMVSEFKGNATVIDANEIGRGSLRRRMEELEKNMHALAADMSKWKGA